MLELHYSNSFLKSLKRSKKRGKNINKLEKVIDILVNEQTLEVKYRNHKLSGDYTGYWELHIEPDWLLVYKVTDKKIILTDIGTHSDLFE
ncbi:MAG TPA: type II toxin-antitoxin system mRNA interferase toxin, RelE/StbE family [Alphaproteobacteria bacterium]|nr:type II toxin-antitoxin system mRNA interferase toxin, RelE/StbE family [Alphaproteobacteria bacterium]